MNREIKKQQLKKRIVSQQVSKDQYRDTRGMQEKIAIHSKKMMRRRIRILLVLLVIIALAGVGYRQYQAYYQYTNYVVSWEKSLEYSEGSFVQYINFASNVLRYSKDGASYIDESGKVVWMKSYEMKTPIVASRGDFVAIADQTGNEIYIFNREGYQGTATTLLPIIKISISQKGLVAAVLEDSKTDEIWLFRKDGSLLDINMRGKLDGDIGYPLDVGLSPSGTQLIGSYLYLSAGTLKNRVAFHNFSEVGKNIPNRFVGGFDDIYESSFVARVLFLTETYACAIADNNISFFNLRNVSSPELIEVFSVEEEIRSIFYSDNYIGLIVNTSSGEFPNRLELYKNNGSKVLSKEFHYSYINAEIDGDYILLYNEDSCQVYNLSGTLVFEYTFDFHIIKMKSGRTWNRFIVIGPQTMKEIKLQ